MLLSDAGYRKYTPEECALLAHGALVLVEQLELSGEDGFSTGVEEFDRMELDEKLVALHTLCLRAASDEQPEKRELWLDATMMAVLHILESQVEMAFEFIDEDASNENYEAVTSLAQLILLSYLSYHWRPEEVSEVPPAERSELDEILLKTNNDPAAVVPFTEQLLTEILNGYMAAFFYDYDFQGADQFLDLPPETHAKYTELMGISIEYQSDTAPSCSPQAVRAAREFFSDKDS